MPRRPITLVDPRKLMRDDIFDNFFSDNFGLTMQQYSLDMYETDQEVVVEVEAPNFKSDDVDISIEDNSLTISGHHKKMTEEEESGKKFHFKEIAQQSNIKSQKILVIKAY